MQANSIWPPDTGCWLNGTDGFADALSDATDYCNHHGLADVTDGMIEFLNLTTFNNYLQAYCAFFFPQSRLEIGPDPSTTGNNPNANDSCPFNVCPNVRPAPVPR